ncbi:citrate (Si)-synthase [Neisseria meningitidis]|uniref:citrate (Si)-synthase n=1 Tax=Neisseria meningitidis TaxID=487 RepID=UPI001E318A84|nr:citrate (Si)-synthase [Neisseria meningitidis]
MPSEPAGRLFQKMPYRCNFMRLYGVGFALQTAYASRSSLVSQSVHDYSGLNLNQYGVASPCRTICTVCCPIFVNPLQ